ncbi:MAG: PqqD family protein [Vulcanimicrobiota bacterium]
MVRQRGKPEKTAVNLLELKPRQNREWSESPGEKLAILQPRFSNELAKKLFGRLNKNPDIRIRLDEFGAFIWKLCDGAHTVREIGIELKSHFGDSVEPAMERLELFLKYLERYEFIFYSNIPELQAAGGAKNTTEEKREIP